MKSKENPKAELSLQPADPDLLSPNGERRHFAVASLVHELTGIHLTFHSLVLLAVGELGINAVTDGARTCASLLGISGAIVVAFVSVPRELRCKELKEFWEGNGQDRIILNNARNSFSGWPEDSRLVLLFTLIVFYLGVSYYPWLNKPVPNSRGIESESRG